jgi:hypothetical protein
MYSQDALHPGGLVSVEIPTIIDFDGFENWMD